MARSNPEVAPPRKSTPGAEPRPSEEKSEALPWLHDAFDTAVTQASSKGLPILVDMWAPWCHTCLSMQQGVLRDPALRPYKDRFVWLALDTDRPENAPLVGRLEMGAWPTFFVLDATGERVLASLSGGVPVAQFARFLDDGLAGVAPNGTAAPHSVALAEATEAIAAGDLRRAEAALVRTLALAPSEWLRKPEVLLALIRTRSKAKNHGPCVSLIDERLDEVTPARSATVTDFVVYGARCVDATGGPRAQARRARMIEALVALHADKEAGLSVDDRSDLLLNLRTLYLADGQNDAANETARTQRDLLATAARAAKSPREAMIYAWPRAEVHVFLNEAAALEPELEALARSLPDEYDPPYRLGWLRMQMRAPERAVKPLTDALAKVYGPRKARVWSLLAQAYLDKGDNASARDAYAGIVAHLEGLPDAQRREEALAKARQQLAAASR